MIPEKTPSESAKASHDLDNELSQRFISLDPSGYFLIHIDLAKRELIVEHFTNAIDELGRATDPETGEILGCDEVISSRTPKQVFRGRTAKQLGIQLTEGDRPFPISCLDHALYMGRELQKAELALTNGTEYIQD